MKKPGRISLFLIALMCQLSVSYAQDEKLAAPDSGYSASPGLRYQQRPKALVFSYDRILNTPVTSSSDIAGDGNAMLSKVEELKVKLKFPIEWRGRTRFYGGINYYYQEYNFENPEDLDYLFYEALENRHLNSLGFQLYVTHSFSRNRFMLARAGAELNGDYHEDLISLTRFLRNSLSFIYGWKKSPDLSYGLGFYMNYDLGGPSLYPVFMYNRNFNSRWGIESAFPKEASLRWNGSKQHTMVYGGYDVSGSTFQLTFPDLDLSAQKSLQLQRSNVRVKLALEREIYDFLWIGMEAGFNITVNMDLSNDNWWYSLDKELINTQFGPAPFVQFQLFVVPPRKFAAGNL